jgi:soluble lytic murein transglycosylase-like protein
MNRSVIALFMVSLVLQAAPSFSFCFAEAAREYVVNPQLLSSIARTESDMNPRAIGTNGNGSRDYGLMQINSFWVGKLGLSVDRLLGDACYNTKTGARILRGCIDRYGTTWQAVGCYNAAANDKRAKYAWKVYRNLAKSRYGTEKGVSAASPVVGKTVPPSTGAAAELHSAVTDIYLGESGEYAVVTTSPDSQTGKP